MSEHKSYTLGLVQMACGSAPAGCALDRAVERVRDAARRGAQVIALPELFCSPYFCQSEDPAFFDLAETVPGPSTETFSSLAAELGVVILAPIFEKRARGLYHNSLAVLDADGRQAGLYRKMHIPDDPSFYEKFYFTPGDLGFRAFDTAFGRIGTLICWDQWYPEAARLTAMQGADLLVYPTAIGWLASEKAVEGDAQLDAWRTVQRGHAIANGLFVAAVNRVGFEPSPTPGREGLEFWGHSFVADPQGRLLAEAGTDEELLLVPIDPARIEEVRRWWPFLRDRRVDAFGGLTERFLDCGESGS